METIKIGEAQVNTKENLTTNRRINLLNIVDKYGYKKIDIFEGVNNYFTVAFYFNKEDDFPIKVGILTNQFNISKMKINPKL